MARLVRTKELKPLLPYFLLALAIIVSFKIINEVDFFLNAVRQFWHIVTPFFHGFVLAYILSIPGSGIQRLLHKTNIDFIVKRKRGFSLLLVFAILALIVAVILNLIVPAVSRSVSFFIANVQTYYQNAWHVIDYINDMELFGLYIDEAAIVSVLQDMLQNVGTGSIQALLSVPSAVIGVFLAFISCIYFLLEKEKFRDFLNRLLKTFATAFVYAMTIECARRVNKNFKQYIHTQTIDGCILGTIVTIELYLLGSPYFLILGIMLGVLNYIPYFGSIVASLIAVVVLAFTQGFSTAVIGAAVLLVTQQIDGNIIQPRLMGGSFALSPLLVIVSITLGGAAAGVFGMIVAIPIVAFLKDVLESVVEYYERQREVNPDESSRTGKKGVFKSFLVPEKEREKNQPEEEQEKGQPEAEQVKDQPPAAQAENQPEAEQERNQS